MKTDEPLTIENAWLRPFMRINNELISADDGNNPYYDEELAGLVGRAKAMCRIVYTPTEVDREKVYEVLDEDGEPEQLGYDDFRGIMISKLSGLIEVAEAMAADAYTRSPEIADNNLCAPTV